MQNNEFSGALQIAQKALRLFPELKNMSQLVAVCEVHCSAQKKVFGAEVDWYAVLQVEKTADVITLKKQFRKLALLFHPDKNKLPSAEAAFKFVGEANRVLSDWEARSLYDKKCRNSVVLHTSHSQKPQARQPKQGSNARNHNGTKKKPESMPNFPTRGHDTSGKVHSSDGYQQVHPETFWSCCPSSHIRYQYLKHFVGKALCCQSCGTAFFAQELSTQDCGIHSQHVQTKFSNVEFSKQDVGNKGASSSDTKFDEIFCRGDGVKGAAGVTQKGIYIGQNNPIPVMDGAHSFGRSSQQKQHIFAKMNSNVEDGFINPPKRARNDGAVPVDQRCGSPHGKCVPENDEGGLVRWPDPDFSDFDKLWSDFAADQVWACYDKDGMPRYYARIKKVLSPGFKLQFVWLESVLKSEAELDWSCKELPVACGYYRTGRTEETEDPLMFSHQLHSVKMPRKSRERLVCHTVYPGNGEIWAIFKNWDIKRTSDPGKHLPFRYEYVEVLFDFEEDSGATVACLHKVRGFVSLYQRVDAGNASEDTNAFYRIPPDEKYRFSHRVPSFTMTGEERSDVPPGSIELDPASLDPDELQDSLEKEHAQMRFHGTGLESKLGNKMANSGNISGGERKVVMGLSSQFPGPKLNPQPGGTRLDTFLTREAREANKEHNSCNMIGGRSHNFRGPTQVLLVLLIRTSHLVRILLHPKRGTAT